MNLAIKELFDGNEVEVYWNDHNEPVMTINQLAKSLGYSEKKGVENLVSRNEYLKNNEFSTVIELNPGTHGLGGTQKTRIFNEDGIYEITMLSTKPKAKEFRVFVRKLLKSLRKGEMLVVQPKSEQDKLKIQQQRAEAMLLNAKTRQAKLILEMQKNKILSPVAVELLGINAIEHITGKAAKTKPTVEKTYTATEIAKEIGVTANKVGRIAKAHGLKTEEYGIWALDKSPYSNKQVESFRYNEKGKSKLTEILGG